MSYIKKELLLAEVLDAKIKNTQEKSQRVLDIFERTIQRQPDADVVEVRHGENITKNHPVDEFICSECGLIMRDCCRYEIDGDADPPDENCYEFEFRYCPRCGVKIDD